MITLIIVTSLILSIISIIVFQNIFIKNNIFDKINTRSSHNSIATRSGGAALFFVLFTISSFCYLTGIILFNYSIIIPLGILFIVGLYDDFYDVDAMLKFIFQIIVAKIIIDNGFIIDNLHGIFGIFQINRLLAQILTILIIVSIINAINFIDGIDGLAISVTILFIIAFEFFAMDKSNFQFLSIISLASLAPLYIFNFRKNNKVFLGDSGSYLLGGIVSIYVLTILSQDYIIKQDFDIHKILFVISILFYPIIDLVRIFIIRLSNGKSPFRADKKHIHHYLNRYFNSHPKTIAFILISSLLIILTFQILFN
tara:strand:- start:3690 stop:4625 length:936 start_codon:yes stop_codon:yes gene_type:complete